MKKFLARIAVTLKEPLAHLVLELVAQTEAAIPGKTGAEKKEYVIGKLDDMIRLPWFLEPFDNAIFDVLIDAACRVLNNRFGHEWTGKINQVDLLAAAERLKKALK